MLLSATSNDVGVNVRLVGYGLSVSRYQGIYSHGPLDVGGRHGIFLLIDAVSWWMERHPRCLIMEAVTTRVAEPGVGKWQRSDKSGNSSAASASS